MKQILRLVLALVGAGAVWWLGMTWLLLSTRETALLAVITAGAVARCGSARRWHAGDTLVLIVALTGFVAIAWQRLAESNLVLVLIMLALTGLLTERNRP